MSSSINGLNSPSFRALSQQFSRGLKHRAEGHEGRNDARSNGTTQADNQTGTQPGVNQRNMTRAERDYELTIRGVNREATHLIDRLGTDTETADKVKQMASDFEAATKARYETFTQGDGRNYMEFVEQTAAARIEFRAQLRDIARSLGDAPSTQPSTQPTTLPTTLPTSGTLESADASSAIKDTVTLSGVADAAPVTGSTPTVVSTPNTERAQRDIDALTRGLDREFERFSDAFGSDSDAMNKFASMRDGFIDAVKQEFDSLAAGSTDGYMGFAGRVVALRQALGRNLNSTYADLSSGTPTTQPTTEPTSVAGTPIVKGDLPEDVLSGTAPSIADRPQPKAPVTPVNERNLARAQRDADVLLRGLERESGGLIDAMGDTRGSAEVKAAADNFRSMLEGRLKQFVDNGGTDYMSFAAEMATARLSLSSTFAHLAGPKLDRMG